MEINNKDLVQGIPCRKIEWLGAFHFESKKDLKNLKLFLGKKKEVKPEIYTDGKVSKRQFNIYLNDGTVRRINNGDWIIKDVLGSIVAIMDDITFFSNYELIKKRKNKN